MIKHIFRPKKTHIVALIEQTISLYENVDRHVREFKRLSGLRCYPGCGRCCDSKKIEVSILEMLPLVFHLFQDNQLDFWQKKLSAASTLDNKKCFLYSQKSIGGQLGHCIHYDWRPLVCRLFGFSSVVDKYGNKILYSCPIIKSKLGNRYTTLTKKIQFQWKIPVSINYYFQLGLIDSGLTRDNHSMNMAMKLAIDVFLNSGFHLYHKSG